MTTEININNFKKEGFSYEEIESIKKGLDNVNKGKTITYNEVKKQAKNKIFSKENSYA